MIPAGVQVYVASMPVDFRKGATGLMALVRDGGADPFSGALYVFRSKRADRIKAVWFDGVDNVGRKKEREGNSPSIFAMNSAAPNLGRLK